MLCMRATPYVEVTLRRHASQQAAVDYMATLQDNYLVGNGAARKCLNDRRFQLRYAIFSVHVEYCAPAW